MEIIITPQEFVGDIDLQKMGMEAVIHGCPVSHDEATGDTTYSLSDTGEMLIKWEHYKELYDNVVTVSKAELFAVLPDTLMDNLVDVDLPHAKYLDEEEGEQRRTYEEYFKWKWRQPDGSWLVKLVPVIFGETSGYGLSDEQFRSFWAWDNTVIKDKATGMALLAALQGDGE